MELFDWERDDPSNDEDIDLAEESCRLLREALTKGCMMLRNGTLLELKASEILSLAKKYADTGLMPQLVEKKDKGLIPEDMSL